MRIAVPCLTFVKTSHPQNIANICNILLDILKIYGIIYSIGRVAQRLEHLLYTQGVTGSNPVSPTRETVQII